MTVAEQVTKQRTGPASQQVQQCNASNQFDFKNYEVEVHEMQELIWIFGYWDFCRRDAQGSFTALVSNGRQGRFSNEQMQAARETHMRPVQKYEPSAAVCILVRQSPV
jgi:hypothetical protein